ncbi:MAG: Fe-S cluster assembly protein SufD [Thermoanaerobaculia bacterium]|nr:Fe-S cluster assembly protein SufD [Thermoanaerobaculia bacterium]
MTTAVATDNRYAAAFETLPEGPEPDCRTGIRRRAIERFTELGFPTMRQEDWRFTNVGPISRTEWVRAEGPQSVDPSTIEPYVYPEMARLVFVNGYFAPDLSDLEGLPGDVTVGSLRTAVESGHEAVEDHLAAHASFDDQPFVALNTAFFTDGPFVHVPRGVVVERPIQLVLVATPAESPTVAYPRILIVAEENSHSTIVETYCGVGEGDMLTVPVTEVVADDAAVVDHYRLQQERSDHDHIALQQYRTGRQSNLSSHSLSFGGSLVRNDVRAELTGEGGECTLNGLYLVKDRQHVDNHLWVEHIAPHCHSHELYKGILEDRGRAVFNGLIHVHQGAQKTDGVQTNRNLLLSPDALVNTNPQLLIFADDVKCTHGSTVGQLDEEAVFYLRSRGIGEEAATSLLIYAFARDIVDRVKLDPVRKDLEEYLFSRLPKGEIVRQAV